MSNDPTAQTPQGPPLMSGDQAIGLLVAGRRTGVAVNPLTPPTPNKARELAQALAASTGAPYAPPRTVPSAPPYAPPSAVPSASPYASPARAEAPLVYGMPPSVQAPMPEGAPAPVPEPVPAPASGDAEGASTPGAEAPATALELAEQLSQCRKAIELLRTQEAHLMGKSTRDQMLAYVGLTAEQARQIVDDVVLMGRPYSAMYEVVPGKMWAQFRMRSDASTEQLFAALDAAAPRLAQTYEYAATRQACARSLVQVHVRGHAPLVFADAEASLVYLRGVPTALVDLLVTKSREFEERCMVLFMPGWQQDFS